MSDERKLEPRLAHGGVGPVYVLHANACGNESITHTPREYCSSTLLNPAPRGGLLKGGRLALLQDFPPPSYFPFFFSFSFRFFVELLQSEIVGHFFLAFLGLWHPPPFYEFFGLRRSQFQKTLKSRNSPGCGRRYMACGSSGQQQLEVEMCSTKRAVAKGL